MIYQLLKLQGKSDQGSKQENKKTWIHSEYQEFNHLISNLSTSFCLFVCMSVCLSFSLSVWLSLCMYVCLSICLYVCLSVKPFVCLAVCLYACLSVCKTKTAFFAYLMPLFLWDCLFLILCVCINFYLFQYFFWLCFLLFFFCLIFVTFLIVNNWIFVFLEIIQKFTNHF